MIPVGLARSREGYGAAVPPYGPAKPHPEIVALLGERAQVGGPSPAYEAVREALRALGLDAGRFGRPDWNPLGDLVPRGARIVLKPNFIRHWNPAEGGTLSSLITHGSVLRAVADYAFIAAGAEGTVTVAEAPQQDCDFTAIRKSCGLDILSRFYREAIDRDLLVIDLRREQVEFQDGIIVRRSRLAGDPLGYRSVDLGSRSFFVGSKLDSRRFRGADYDPVATTTHHSGGRHEYLLSETVLQADLVVNLPKLKTHKKTGVTLALKNLVGINGDKNWLPHHTAGAATSGGDEFPSGRLRDRMRSRAIEIARPLLHRGIGTRWFRYARRLEAAARGLDFVRSGNWYGNATTWRMCLDLNRCLYYSDREGLHAQAARPLRQVLTVLDGIVSGEGEGPLAPRDVPLGIVLASTDPVALDLVAIRLMGFEAERIPKLREAMGDADLPITAVRTPSDVEVREVSPSGTAVVRALEEIGVAHRFQPHPGWRGHVEQAAPQAFSTVGEREGPSGTTAPERSD